MDTRPDWLQKYAIGLQGGYRYIVYLDGIKFAIIKEPGHTAYIDRCSGSKYYATQYTLIEKGTSYWNHKHKTVWEGRINSHVKVSLVSLLADYDSGTVVFK